MKGALVRIVARWLAGGLVALGFFSPETADLIATNPDFLILVGGVVGLVTEGAYLKSVFKRAKK